MENLKKAHVISTAVDESTDLTDMAQLCTCVRFHGGVHVRKELLGLWRDTPQVRCCFKSLIFNERD